MRDATPWYAFDTHVGTYQEERGPCIARSMFDCTLYRISLLPYPPAAFAAPLRHRRYFREPPPLSFRFFGGPCSRDFHAFYARRRRRAKTTHPSSRVVEALEEREIRCEPGRGGVAPTMRTA